MYKKDKIISHKYIDMLLIIQNMEIKLQFNKKLLLKILMDLLLNLRNRQLKLRNYRMEILRKDKLMLWKKMGRKLYMLVMLFKIKLGDC